MRSARTRFGGPLAAAVLAVVMVADGPSALVAQQPPLKDALLTALSDGGSEGLFRRYVELRRAHPDDEVYDWGPGPINELYRELISDGRVDDAYEIIHINARFNRDDREVQLLHGDAHERKGETMEAVLAFQNALEINPRHEEARDRMVKYWGGPEPRALGEVLLDAHRNDAGELDVSLARDAFEEYQRLYDEFYGSGLYDFSVTGLGQYALDLHAEGRSDEALAIAHLNRDTHAADPEAEWVHGAIHRLRGDPPDEPRLAFARTAEHLAARKLAQRELRETVFRLESRRAGEGDLTPERAEAELAYGEALLAWGEVERARIAFERVLRVQPDHEDATRRLNELGR